MFIGLANKPETPLEFMAQEASIHVDGGGTLNYEDVFQLALVARTVGLKLEITKLLAPVSKQLKIKPVYVTGVGLSVYGCRLAKFKAIVRLHENKYNTADRASKRLFQVAKEHLLYLINSNSKGARLDIRWANFKLCTSTWTGQWRVHQPQTEPLSLREAWERADLSNNEEEAKALKIQLDAADLEQQQQQQQ